RHAAQRRCRGVAAGGTRAAAARKGDGVCYHGGGVACSHAAKTGADLFESTAGAVGARWVGSRSTVALMGVAESPRSLSKGKSIMKRGWIPRGVPRTVPFSDPNGPEATGGGSPGYNRGLPDGGY